MLFAIYALDNLNVQQLRQTNYPAHKAFLANAANYNVSIILSGPLMSDDASHAIGSLFVIDTENKQAATTFHEADPFFMADIWASSNMHLFERRR
jgi:uncharacterized protein